MAFIEPEKLYGLGCGVVDLTLLASACMTPQGALWTMDRRLSELANRYGVEFSLPMHYRSRVNHQYLRRKMGSFHEISLEKCLICAACIQDFWLPR
jgi:hypothetical protein